MIGLFGGTFDPVHLGHLAVAHGVLEQTHCLAVWFIPCKSPVLKSRATASAEHRVKMLTLALEDSKDLEVDTREIDRDTPSYMIETLKDFLDQYPNENFALILGMDAYLELPRWHQWEKLIHYTDIIVVNRPNTTTQLPPELQAWQDKFEEAIEHITLPPVDISATAFREHPSPEAVPPAVWDYIKKNQIY